MFNNKKNTFEQHDNEKKSYYKYSIEANDESIELQSNLQVDVCVIGGGFTGVSAALHLEKKGYKVALLEARKIGWGASGRNGGQLTCGLRKDQSIIENILGFDHAKELWNLSLESVQEVLKNIKDYNIDCSIVNGVMSAGYFKEDYRYFSNLIEHSSKKYNFNEYKLFNLTEIKEEINTNKYYSGLLNNISYHLNPLKYLLGLSKKLKSLNKNIFENSHALDIEEFADKLVVKTDKGKVTANYVVCGCNGYLDALLGKIRNKFMPINNYIIATEPLGQKKAEEIIRNNYAVCDTRFIIDYYRFSEDWRMLFGGGETFTSNFLHDPIKIVSNRMYKIFPNLKEYNIDFAWGGTLAITVNRLPHFGTLLNDKLIFCHGYSGHGIGLSNLAGKLISEKISGNPERFNFFRDINHLTIFGGDFLRRPIYAAAIGYYKIRDII